jgi:hypothetical protein
MNDVGLRQLFNLCKEKNKFIFEVCDIFGSGLTIEEMEYWFVYNVITSASIYDVNISHMTFEDALEEIERAERNRRRKSKWQGKKGSSQKSLPSPKR